MVARTLALLAVVVAVLALAIVIRMILLSIGAERPGNLGPRDGALARCPKSPNCVSTRARDEKHAIAPLRLDMDQNDAVEAARRAIASMPGSRLVITEEAYIHAEFTSRVFRFVDDLELLYDADLPGFQLRSASRVGQSDLGVNRRRVEELRRRLLGAR